VTSGVPQTHELLLGDFAVSRRPFFRKPRGVLSGQRQAYPVGDLLPGFMTVTPGVAVDQASGA
jgi:hypothetical protein